MASKIKIGTKNMYRNNCNRCGKQMTGYTRKQIKRMMDIHLLSCKGKEIKFDEEVIQNDK